MRRTSVAKCRATLTIFLAVILSLSVTVIRFGYAQQQIPAGTTDELVTYEKKSNFIKEFRIPIEERGLRGITTDSQGNAWFLHSTNKTSIIMKLEPDSGGFAQYPIKDETVADNPVIDLAAAQLVFDKERNAVWFTDARVNSIGKLDEASGQVKLWRIPTKNSGPMGIVLSPDGSSLWFAEIIGNKIASFDIQSERLLEYPTGEDSGPALLTFDDKGQLWVSLSFSDSIMLVQPWALVPNSTSSLGMTMMSLPKPDRFSPFGIAVTGGKVFVSDHGSSRVIVADANSNFQTYDLYWTSPSSSALIPTTLPGQVIADKRGNVYFPQHGGNRISEIRQEDGLMTEYDIPTGPLSTVLFLTTSDDERRVWFTEWASNNVAYLDTSIQFPFDEQIPQQQSSITLTQSGTASLNVSINSNASAMGNSSSLPLSEVEVGLTGMTESGIMGITYQANPPRVDLQENTSAESTIHLQTQQSAKPGRYTAMVRVQAPEQDGLVISRLYPIKLVLDVPQPAFQTGGSGSNNSQGSAPFDLRDLVRASAVAAILGLVGLIVYRRAKRKPSLSKD